ncbi:MAG TPA: 1,4-alpha-glucan branching enzyme [Deltaproteobacteria bacterium]|jgi:1,4-alpha-glucan branching enzyme|nr:1,4-alpha-glucan branching enzyme [Deltaproteobacteria bacterium]
MTRRRSSPSIHPLAPEPSDVARLLAGEHSEPHRVLGAHSFVLEGTPGCVVRAWHPDATGCECLIEQTPGVDVIGMEPLDAGLFAGFVPGVSPPFAYRLRLRFADGNTWLREDPYRFLPTLGELDLHLFNEGTHRKLWEVLGAHPRRIDHVDGVSFAVWAPAARRVSVVGDFCNWDGRLLPMRVLGSSGVFELFVPGVAAGALYKFEIKTREDAIRLKADPMAFSMELPPGCAARVTTSSYHWRDAEWMSAREKRDLSREPLAIYEVHLGSFARVPEEGNRALTYREIAPKLVEHVKRLGFTHVQLLPVAEHPFSGSWGYQVTGYYAPTSRYGTPDDFRFFVDHCHQHGIGVLLDWVPAHFPRDDFALRRFDGTALYEHEDPRLGEHPDWGTLIFNYGRHEVRSFLIANAIYWLQEFHIDGLRVDAVASMLYLDYSRKEGEWIPNQYGGRENIAAIDFLRTMNDLVHAEHPGCLTIAEESTAWGGVTKPTTEGGLGFSFKWNMGWMNDTLTYFEKDPVHRKWHHDTLTFAMLYEYSERFIMPLSHDEVVHGKRSLLQKMPGDLWQKFANLRLLLAYQWTRPGKKLLFMGSELAPDHEWWYEASLDWHLLGDPPRAALVRFIGELGRLYRESPCLWRWDHDPAGFRWIDCGDRISSVLTFERWDGDAHLIAVFNFTPVPRAEYRIGVPTAGTYVRRLSSDDPAFGGSQFWTYERCETAPVPWHGRPQSILLRLPPLGALMLAPGVG